MKTAVFKVVVPTPTYRSFLATRVVRLKTGETKEFAESHWTDEGWSSQAQKYSFDGEVVHYERMDDGTDCDGRLSSFQEYFCPFADLRSDSLYPDWQLVDRYQRDYYAEAMGY